jgi:uncharacterized RDD family membrane protein YckC
VNNPYQTPSANLDQEPNHEYVGFWLRVVASLIDTALLVVLLIPLFWGMASFMSVDALTLLTASETQWYSIVLQYLFPAMVVVVFWKYKSATPGKMIFGAKIVDAKTGETPSTGKLIGRYLAYYVSALPLLLGMFWVGWDKRKQGWHDKLAGTVVIRSR